MICKNCNSEIPDNLASCPKCGASTNIDIQLFCKHCGTKLKKEDEFCTSCGKYTEKKIDEIETDKAVAVAMVWFGFVVPIIGFIIEASVFLPSIFYFLY